MVVLRRSVTFEACLKVPIWDLRHGALLSPKYSEPHAEREHAMRSRGEPGTRYRVHMYSIVRSKDG